VILRLGLLTLTGCQVVFPVGETPSGDARPSEARYVQSVSTVENGVAEIQLSFARPIVEQDLIIVVVGTYENDLLELKDSSGNLYQEPSLFVQTSLMGRLHVLYTFGTAAETLTVTARGTPKMQPQLTLAIHAYRGISPDAVVSKSTETGVKDPSITEVPLVADNTLMFAAMTHDRPFGDPPPVIDAQPGPGFVGRERPTDDPTVDVTMITEDRFGVPAGNAEATFSLGADTSWAMQVVAFE
jgi:hypothetical protein